MQKTEYMVFAGRQYFLGDKCQVTQPSPTTAPGSVRHSLHCMMHDNTRKHVYRQVNTNANEVRLVPSQRQVPVLQLVDYVS